LSPRPSARESANSDGYIALCRRDFDARATVAGIRVPTLVISGTHDAATTPADGRFLAEHIAGASYAELNAAHLSNIEDRNRFNSEIGAFLLSP
jgi:3-oxoadipate enol-lactonase